MFTVSSLTFLLFHLLVIHDAHFAVDCTAYIRHCLTSGNTSRPHRSVFRLPVLLQAAVTTVTAGISGKAPAPQRSSSATRFTHMNFTHLVCPNNKTRSEIPCVPQRLFMAISLADLNSLLTRNVSRARMHPRPKHSSPESAGSPA